MNRCLRDFALTMVLLTVPQPSSATNILFLPGDAFFSTSLTEEVVKQLKMTADPEFKYRSPDWIPGAFCGYAGFDRLRFSQMPDAFKERLRLTYERLRETHPQELLVLRDEETGKRELLEKNGFLTLIYNAGYDFHQRGLLAKYNENWPKEASVRPSGYGGFPGDPSAPAEAPEYEPFVNDARLVMREWRYADEVSALRLRLPEKLQTTTSGIRTDPAIVDGPIKFVILTDPKLKNYLPESRAQIDFYVVQEDQIEHWYRKIGKSWELPRWELLKDE
jgi:hypothetical protein